MDMLLNKDVLNTQRTSRAWSQTHLANASGLSLRTVQRIEKSGSASLESAKALASVYEISISMLKQAEPQAQSKTRISNKLSVKGKLISFVFAIPLVGMALYLLWSGHIAMAWIDTLRDSIFSDTISQARRDKISFLIAIVASGLPALIPGFIYDYVKGQGLFASIKNLEKFK